MVPGKGSRGANIALVGEQPAVNEMYRGEPFVGAAGDILDECLYDTSINRSDIYVTNVIKDGTKPLGHFIKLNTKGEVTFTSPHWDFSLEYLKEELEYIKPNVVIPLGNVPLYALTQRTGISKWRSSIIESTLVPGLKTIPTFHPSSVLPKTEYGKKDIFRQHLIKFDLQRAKNESNFTEIIPENTSALIRPTFTEVINFLQECQAHSIIDIDIEVVNEELDCIALAIGTNPIISMCIPFTDSGDYFSPDQEAEILLTIAKLIENPSIAKRGQNFSFDLWFLLRKYGIKPRGKIHDTMVAQKICLPDYPAGLDFITTTHTRIPYYKGEGKKWLTIGGNRENWWTYNATDGISTRLSHPKQILELESQGNIDAYNERCRLLKVIIYMQERGIKVNVQGMIDGREEVRSRVNQLEAELKEIVGYAINYNSPKQMKEYFYGEKKQQPYKKWTGSKYVETCDEKAMARLARKGFKEASLITELRTLTTKHLGTYLSLDKIDPDGRYRSSYNPVGARTGRLSSGENIFGTGGNQQNWPPALLKYMLADEGYIAFSMDLSQAENRIVAYVGMIIELIEAFETGIDVHRKTAGIIFNKPWEAISDEKGSTTIGGGKYSERDIGKKGNHAIDYDIGYREFALHNEILERDAKRILESIHAGIPGIKNGYQATIKAMLRKNRTIINPFGESRLFMDEWPSGERGDLFKAAYAHLPQSTVGRKINSQGLNYIYYNQDRFGPVELLRQVHDDIGFQIPINIGWQRMAEILLDIKASLETPLVWNEREFVIPVDISMGLSFCKLSAIEIKHKNCPKSVEKMARLLQSNYDTLCIKAKEEVK
jgi:uracil-DNA glycosylase family 4